MRRLLLILLLVPTHFAQAQRNAVDSLQKENAKNHSPDLTMEDSVAAAAIVADFFKAFDEKDTVRMRALLLPGTAIVHHNGAVTNTEEMKQKSSMMIKYHLQKMKN